MTLLERVCASGPWPGVALVQVTLVAVLGLLAWLVVRRGGPALRGAVLLGALLGLLIVPGLDAVAPVWLPLPAFALLETPGQESDNLTKPAPTPPPASATGPVVITVPQADPFGKQSIRLGDPVDPLDDPLRTPEDIELNEALFFSVEDAAPPARAAEPAHRNRPWPVAGVLGTVWLLGALVYLARALAHLGLLYLWAWRARPVRDRKWAACLSSLAQRYGLSAVELRESAAVTSPLTLGLFRPVILLPRGRRSWSTEQRSLILAHELAHVRRRDFLAGLAAELAACLLWFHPLVRWLASRLRLEQEYTADAWAVSAANDAMTYVRCLARLALELGQGRGSLAPAFWRRRPEILRRIDMLRRYPHGHSPRLGKGTVWTVTMLAAAACVAVAGVGPLRSVAEALPLVNSDAAPEVKAPATADLHGDPLPAGALARLGTTRWRHGANITFVAFGPEGKTLITAGEDHTVRLWDLATGQEIRRFAQPKPAENKLPLLLPPKKAQLEADQAKFEVVKAQLAAQQIQLEVVEKQLTAVKPPVKVPARVADGKDQPDAAKAKVEAQKAQAEKQKLETLKAQLGARKAQLEAQAKQLTLARGDTNSFTVAVTPDGKTLATANANTIQLYEVERGKELQKIEAPRTGLVGLLFSPDGQTLAARGGDGALTLWETATGKVIQQIKAPSQPNDRAVVLKLTLAAGGSAPGMAFTPDSKSLAVAATEVKEQTVTTSVKFWDVATGKETGQVKGPDGSPVSAVALAPGGKILAYGANNVLYLWELDTSKEIRQIKLPDGVASLVFAPDGKTLAVRGRSQQVRVWETESGKELYQLGDAAPAAPRGAVVLARTAALAPETRTLAFSPDGKQIVTATGSTIRLWDGATGKEKALSESHQGSVTAVVLSADGKTVVSWGADHTICRWETATGKQLGSFHVPQGATMAALAPDGRTVALAIGSNNSILVLDTATGKELHKLAGPPNGTSALAYTPDGTVLAARGGDHAIRLYDVAHGGEMRLMTAQAANNTAVNDIVVLKTATRLAANTSAGLVFSPDGKLLASPGSSSSVADRPLAAGGAGGPRMTIDLYDVMTGKIIRKIELTQPIVSLAFSPDGRVLATENTDHSVTLWEVASGKERAQLGKAVATRPAPAAGGGAVFAVIVAGGFNAAEPAGPTSLAFSPDGRALASRGSDNSVNFWDVTAGKEVSHLKGHEGRVETIAFAPDGKTIATGSADTTLLLWDATALMKEFPKPQTAELAEGAVEPLWNDLASEDAAKALQGVLKLAGAPQQAVPFLGGRLKPAAAVDPRKVERWITDLENEKFAVRQEASTNLLKTGEQVVPALQKVLASQPTIETRKRVEELLEKLTGGNLTTEQLRMVRAVEALERMATAEARQLLQTLAQGAPGALTTRQAQAALERRGR